MRKFNYFLPLLILFIINIIFYNVLVSQCLIVNTPLENRIENSEFVLEGRVIAKSCSWDTDHRNIYTSNSVLIINKIKGDIINDTINILTRGGIVAGRAQVDHPSLQLEVDDIGLFFLRESNIELLNYLKIYSNYTPEYSSLSFIYYDLASERAYDAFTIYNNIKRDVYGVLLKMGLMSVSDYEIPFESNSYRSPDAVNISSFSPTTLTAGTQTVLTINGSDFGASQGSGKVGFSDADDGGSSYMNPIASEYISWSNTEIQVEVPSSAGTGMIKVTNNSGSNDEAGTLYVDYNLININYNNSIYRLNLVDADGSGGLEFVFNIDFYNDTEALPSFKRAMDTWRCSNGDGTGVFFEDGGSSTTDDSGSDGVNIISFDIGSSLPSGVLGRTSNYYAGCGSPLDWYVEEVDIIFNDNGGGSGYNWNFDGVDGSTNSNEYDFESVAVHELGHGHQLGHVINSGQIMHYSISNGQERRYLSLDDWDAGNAVLSFSSGVCGNSAMGVYVCDNLPLEFISFDATHGKEKVELEWEMADIFNLDRIVVQKSVDGKTFMELGVVRNIKESNYYGSFSYTDEKLSEDNYYRLKAIDRDGNYFFSDILFIYNANYDKLIDIYPNPVNTVLHLINNSTEKVGVNLLDSKGVVRKNTELIENCKTTIDVQSLSAGVYYIQFISNQKVSGQRIIIE